MHTKPEDITQLSNESSDAHGVDVGMGSMTYPRST